MKVYVAAWFCRRSLIFLTCQYILSFSLLFYSKTQNGQKRPKSSTYFQVSLFSMPISSGLNKEFQYIKTFLQYIESSDVNILSKCLQICKQDISQIWCLPYAWKPFLVSQLKIKLLKCIRLQHIYISSPLHPSSIIMASCLQSSFPACPSNAYSWSL